MPQSDEEWAPVPGYEGLYEVSDQGRVRSLDRSVYTEKGGEHSRPVEGKILSYAKSDRRSPVVELWRDGRSTRVSVARLVLLAHGPEPESQKRHALLIDPDGKVCLENLRWGRPTHKKKLTEDQAATIYKWAWETSMTQETIGRHFGVSHQTVSAIKNGRNWSHVTEEIDIGQSETE